MCVAGKGGRGVEMEMMERKFVVKKKKKKKKNNKKKTKKKKKKKKTRNSLVSLSIESVATRATLHLEICL